MSSERTDQISISETEHMAIVLIHLPM